MRTITLYAAMLIMIFATGCGGNKDPKKVLIAFMEALSKKDIATAKKYATQDSQGMLDLVQMSPQKPDEFKPGDMRFGDPRIEGDKATITVKNKNFGPTTTYSLKKESSGWKVAFNKESMPQMIKEGQQ